MIMGGLYPITVVAGIHHMYNVIEAGMLSEAGGLNIWMPIASAANFAQCAACLAVGLKAKSAKTKSIAIPSSLSAALDYAWRYTIVLAVSFVIAFILTWFLWKEDEEDAKKAVKKTQEEAQGEGFEVFVSEGDTVKTGQRLMTFSIDQIKQSGYSTTTAVLLNNSDDYENFKVVRTGAAKKSEPVITI